MGLINSITSSSHINVRNQDGQTALHLALSKKGNNKIARKLIEKDADINIADKNGDSPLHLALKNMNSVIASEMLEGDKINFFQNNDGKTILHTAIDSIDRQNSLKIINKINDVKILNLQDKDGNSALHIAIELWDQKSIKALIEKGVDLNLQNTLGETPLHLAMQEKNLDLVLKLIEKDADINIPDKHNRKFSDILNKYRDDVTLSTSDNKGGMTEDKNRILAKIFHIESVIQERKNLQLNPNKSNDKGNKKTVEELNQEQKPKMLKQSLLNIGRSIEIQQSHNYPFQLLPPKTNNNNGIII